MNALVNALVNAFAQDLQKCIVHLGGHKLNGTVHSISVGFAQSANWTIHGLSTQSKDWPNPCFAPNITIENVMELCLQPAFLILADLAQCIS